MVNDNCQEAFLLLTKTQRVSVALDKEKGITYAFNSNVGKTVLLGLESGDKTLIQAAKVLHEAYESKRSLPKGSNILALYNRINELTYPVFV